MPKNKWQFNNSNSRSNSFFISNMPDTLHMSSITYNCHSITLWGSYYYYPYWINEEMGGAEIKQNVIAWGYTEE